MDIFKKAAEHEVREGKIWMVSRRQPNIRSESIDLTRLLIGENIEEYQPERYRMKNGKLRFVNKVVMISRRLMWIRNLEAQGIWVFWWIKWEWLKQESMFHERPIVDDNIRQEVSMDVQNKAGIDWGKWEKASWRNPSVKKDVKTRSVKMVSRNVKRLNYGLCDCHHCPLVRMLWYNRQLTD